VRCGRCGNENAATNRFCGMCGASLVGSTPAAGQSSGEAPAGNVAAPKPAAVPVQQVPVPSAPGQREEEALPESARFRATNVETRRTPHAPELRPSDLRPSEVRPSPGPVISGPSILGLSTPGPAADRRVEHDPLRPSSNLDYLLEDEEDEPQRSWGKVVLIGAALALAVGFGYLHFKQGGFDWLNADGKKPAATKPSADAAQGTDSGAATGPATPDGVAPAAGGTTPAASGPAASPAESPAASVAPSQSAPQAAAPAASSQTTPAQTTPAQTAPAQAGPAQGPPSDPNIPAAAAAPAAAPDNQAPAPPPAPKAVTKPPAAKPIDPVTNAERYIYGRGVRQDCDHGLRLLKPQAEQSNPKAMITLGALYSTGTCTPRDLPTAYRWFALALHKEPDDQALQDDLQKLWSQMTQPERQLAIKLSQ
jgi:hypothetical protein